MSNLSMTIASLYPSLRGQEIPYKVLDWDFIRALLHYSEEINDFHVFLPLDCHPPEQLPDVSNVYIHSVMELSEFFQENSVDVWHDFGYNDVSHLTHIRRLSHQKYPITMQVQPWRLAVSPSEVGRELSEYDALICSKSSIHSLIGSTDQHSEQGAASRHFEAEVFTIPPGVNILKGNITKKTDARHLLDLPEHDIIILCLTDFSVYEGGDLFPLIRAVHPLTEKRRDIRLIISGPDEYGYADKFENLLKDSPLHRQIVLRPQASDTAQSLLLSAADIFISPSDTIHRDNHLQILTAMSHSLPVIATDDDEHGLISHGKNGLKLRQIYNPSSYKSLNTFLPLISEAVKPLIISQGIVVDTQQMIEFLRLLIEKSALRRTLGDAACHYVAANHGWSTIAKKYVHLWQMLREKMLSIPESEADNSDSLVPGTNTESPPFFSLMSQDVEDNTSLQLTFSGETLLATQHFISYDAMKDIIYPPVVFEILNVARSVVPLSEMINALVLLSNGNDTNNLVPNITYHIMWCLKQGFISVSGKRV